MYTLSRPQIQVGLILLPLTQTIEQHMGFYGPVSKVLFKIPNIIPRLTYVML
jgi:hypothetical protein